MASAGGQIENYHLPVGSLSSQGFSIIPTGEKRLTNSWRDQGERDHISCLDMAAAGVIVITAQSLAAIWQLGLFSLQWDPLTALRMIIINALHCQQIKRLLTINAWKDNPHMARSISTF